MHDVSPVTVSHTYIRDRSHGIRFLGRSHCKLSEEVTEVVLRLVQDLAHGFQTRQAFSRSGIPVTFAAGIATRVADGRRCCLQSDAIEVILRRYCVESTLVDDLRFRGALLRRLKGDWRL